VVQAVGPERRHRGGSQGRLVSLTASAAEGEPVEAGVRVAPSARLLGTLRLGASAYLAQGAVIRSSAGPVELGAHSALLENGVAVGYPEQPVHVGQKTVFGHRCLVIGATVGNLCEIGNGSIILPGVRLGDRCFLGEGTVVPAGMQVPEQTVLVGRPATVLRQATDQDLERLSSLRDGDLSLPGGRWTALTGTDPGGGRMGQLYAFRDKFPQVAASAVLFDSAEVTGDVVIGEECIIGAGVKIIGDSHGPVRIGAGVQILENSVLHLLPDNELVLEDDVIIGPGAMIHGCHIGAETVVEPGVIVCDGSHLGRGCLVRAGTLVKQRDRFDDRALIEGFPGTRVGTLPQPPSRPAWALRREDLASLLHAGPS
jgi:carbonic anhydrase/acetyltransferase-like protein (isoleucine patch superfamily)